ncbi:MAG TPA: hypothetical protein VL325_08955 [Pyrinomonadaceae bacterium]|nr:hypothetical protein [Pyrinomonadaceae bacterium]
MIDPAAIADIISLYKKHGWTLRRLLMSPEGEKALRSVSDLPKGVETRSSDLDGAWFSRSSNPERETWELRLLEPTPFALLDVLDMTATETEREEALKRVEERWVSLRRDRPAVTEIIHHK